MGSGLWRAKSFFSSGPKLPFKRLKPLKRFDTCHGWILDASDAPWTLQTLQNLALARLWALGSVPDCGPYWPLEQPASGFWTLQTLQNLALARLWALGSARLWAELRRLWARGSGAPNPLFFSGPKLPFKRLKPLKPLKPLKRFDTCQWLCHTSGFWTLQTLHGRFRRSKTSHLLDGGLWALRDCGRSCAGCGLGALARQILFF